MQRRVSAPLVMLAVLVALPGAVQAQDRELYRLPLPAAPATAQTMGRAVPGVASSSPVGFGPARGDAFVGVGYQQEVAGGTTSDGAGSFGFGLLSPLETIGIEMVFTSLSTVRSGFGSRMVGAMKVHKILKNGVGVAIGHEGFRLTGDEFDTRDSYYIVATQNRTLRDAPTFNAVTLNGGIGSGRFQSAEALADGKSGVGIFASAALRVNSYSSAILDYTGAQLNAALSFSPSAKYPLVITPSINDVTGAAGQAGRLALAAGLSWKF